MNSSLSAAYDCLRRHILSGTCHACQPIDFIALGLEANSEEVCSAVCYLEAEGLLERRDGGIFLIEKPARSRRSTGFINDYSHAGRHPKVYTLSLDITPGNELPQDIRALYGADSGQLFIKHRSVQFVDSTPHAICTSFIPYEKFGNFYSRLRNCEQDLFGLMGECGYPPDRKREALRFDFPSQEERDLLDISELNRIMVVRLDCIVWSGDHIVEVCELVDRADLYEFIYEVGIDK